MSPSGPPLVAVANPSGASDPWAGVWLAEDIETIHSGIAGGSWIDGTLGGVSAGLDTLALVSDPLGTLLEYGVAWIIEHVKPLTEALDWLAGNPAEISAQAATWRNIAGSLHTQASELERATHWNLAEWTGGAADAYQTWSGRQRDSLGALAKAAETMAAMTEGAGALVAGVRMMVRDAIATLVSRLITYAAEEAFTLGLGTPLVVEQVTTLCASWAARISEWLRSLIRSLAHLRGLVGRLNDAIDAIKALLKRLGGGKADLMGRKVVDPALRPQAPVRPPDDHLPAGDPVYYSQSSTAIGYDAATMRNFDVAQPEPGFHDVVVHGERNGTFRPGLVGEDGKSHPANFTHPHQIAEAVANNPDYSGEPVRLVSCHSGTVDPASGVPPAAQQVANSLGVPVMAPTNIVGVRRVGSGLQVPEIGRGGTWKMFYPEAHR